MLTSTLCAVLFAVPPAWKVEVVHQEDLQGKTKYQSNPAGVGTVAMIKEAFLVSVTEPGEPRPKAVDLEMTRGTLGKVTVKQEYGEAVVRFENMPKDPRIRVGLSRYFERLVREDPLRAAMGSCDSAGQEATGKWLHQNMAYVTASQLEELKLSDVSIRCKKAKSGVVHEVSLRVAHPRGRNTVDLKLKGKVAVDPALWATTWQLSGPMHVVFDSRGMGLAMSGTFTTAFNLSRK